MLESASATVQAEVMHRSLQMYLKHLKATQEQSVAHQSIFGSQHFCKPLG